MSTHFARLAMQGAVERQVALTSRRESNGVFCNTSRAIPHRVPMFLSLMKLPLSASLAIASSLASSAPSVLPILNSLSICEVCA